VSAGHPEADVGSQTARQSESERTAPEREAYEVVTSCYALGDVLAVNQLFGGYENLSFKVTVQDAGGQRRYFLRKCKPSTTENEIGFEVSLLEHLAARGFTISAGVVLDASACAFECRPDQSGQTCFWSLYDYLEGQNKYTWVENELTEREYAQAGALLARFHAAAADFDPGDYQRVQPPILDLVPMLPQMWSESMAHNRGTATDEFLLSRIDDALRTVAAVHIPADDLSRMPRLPVHCDYHPGNLKYTGDEITGLFDFDWSKIDYRLFDVAVGCVYFCSSWREQDEGELWIDSAATFVTAYQDEAARHESPGPLNAAELRNFVQMLTCANLYVLNWDITYFYLPGDPDPEEYLTFLRHNVLLMDFINAHRDQIELRITAPLAESA